MDDVALVDHPHNAQVEIVVLAAVIGFPPAACRTDIGGAVHREVVEIVLAQEQVRVPAWLEERIKPPDTVLFDLVLVGIENFRSWMALQSKSHLGERMRPQYVVMVEQRHILAAHKLEGRVGRLGDMSVYVTKGHLDARIFGHPPLQGRFHPAAGEASSAMQSSQLP